MLKLACHFRLKCSQTRVRTDVDTRREVNRYKLQLSVCAARSGLVRPRGARQEILGMSASQHDQARPPATTQCVAAVKRPCNCYRDIVV